LKHLIKSCNVSLEKLKAADEKRNDELTAKLEDALTQKQEADAQNEHLKKRLQELEEAVKNGVQLKVFYIF